MLGLLFAISAVLSGIQTIVQARLAKAQGSYASKVAEFNARQSEQQARERLRSAQEAHDQLRRRNAYQMAFNIAAASKSGLSISDSRSSLEVLADTAYQMKLDQNKILTQGMKDYYSLFQQASLLRSEGKYQERIGNQAGTIGTVMGLLQAGLGMYGLGIGRRMTKAYDYTLDKLVNSQDFSNWMSQA